MPTPEDPFNRKPWPMKWIIVTILVTIIPYTWITLAYRKPNPAHEPYQDNKDRAQVLRLLEHEFSRIDLPVKLMVDPDVPPAETTDASAIAGGIPPLLSDLLIDKPPVPVDFPLVAAPSSALSGVPYVITVAFTQPDLDERVEETTLYRRHQELVLIIDYQPTPDGLQARRKEVTAQITIPANTLQPGEYRATLVGDRESRRWTFVVH